MAKGIYPPSVQPGIPRLTEPPNGWARVTYGEILREVQRPIKLDDEKEYQLVVAKRSRGGIEPRERLLGRKILTKTQFEIKARDFLVSNRQIVHGACGIVPQHLDGSVVSNEYTVLHANDVLDLTFLNHFTNSIFFQQTCFHASVGVDVEKMIFRIAEWFKMELNLPPLEEQKKIAEILSTWDRAIESLNVKFNQHLSFENAVIEKLFIEERNWNVSAISDLASSEPNSFKDGDWVEAPHIKDFGVRLLQTGNVGVGQIRNTNKRYISEASFDELGCKEVRVGDILICRLADPIGRCCIVPDLGESKYITSVDVIIFRPKSEIHRSFLIASLNRPAVLAKAASVSGGSTRQRVSRTAYGSITIGLPDPEHQRRIGEIWQLLTQMRSEILQQIELVTKQKQGLMQKLLTGKVRVKV